MKLSHTVGLLLKGLKGAHEGVNHLVLVHDSEKANSAQAWDFISWWERTASIEAKALRALL